MAVYDKELIIDGKAVRSPEQQVYKNMKDIQALQQIIKKMYKTSEELTDASVNVAIADTNAPDGTTEGWLITEDGLLFNITGGDDTNLLLAYYSDLKGPQGETGPGGDPSSLIDDNTISQEKTWSSYLIDYANKINMMRIHTFFTSATPTDDGTYYYFDKDDLTNPSGLDKEAYVGRALFQLDSNGKVTTVYQVTDFNTDTRALKCVKMAEFSQGKQLYQHNITITNNNHSNYVIRLQIENDSIEAFNYTSLRQWLNAKGFNAVATNPQYYKAIGNYYVYGELCDVVGVADNNGNPNALWLQGVKKDGSAIQTDQLGSHYRFNDVVIPL